MKYQFLKVCCLFMLVASCRTININLESQRNTTQQLSLGSIGSSKDYILQKGFNSSAIPSYKEPIKVWVTIKPFNKQTFKTFTKAKALQPADVAINYVDSIAVKPKYIQLQIADKVAVITALNSEVNTAVKNYLTHNTYANVLTSVSLTLNTHDLENITKADAVFLVENGVKQYALQLYEKQVKTQIILFNQGVVFEYKTSNCCWQENKYHKLDIVDLVSDFNSCPSNTNRSAKRAEKKINTLNY
jgi:hypothetical protein